MISLNVDPNYFDHPKTKRLIGLLGKGSEVLPLRLWAYYARAHSKEDGRLTGYSAQEIEAIADWWGPPDAMVSAMMKPGVNFVDRDEDGTYRLHDWLDHQGHIRALTERAQQLNDARWARLRAQKAAVKARDAPQNPVWNPVAESGSESATESSIPLNPQIPPNPQGGGRRIRVSREERQKQKILEAEKRL